MLLHCGRSVFGGKGLARKTTGRNSKAGSGPATDESNVAAKAGTEPPLTPPGTEDASRQTPETFDPDGDGTSAPESAGRDAAAQTPDAPVPAADTDTQNPVPPEAISDAEPGAPQIPGIGVDSIEGRSDSATILSDPSGQPADSDSEPGTAPIVGPDQDSPASTTPPLTAPPSPPASGKGGFLPMLLGGVVAGGIGFGAHYLLSQDAGGQAPEIAALQAEITELRAELAAAPDLTALEAELAELRAALGDPDAATDSLDVAGQIAAEIDALRAEFAQDEAGAVDPAVLDRLDGLRSDLSETAARLDGFEADLAARDTRISALQDELAELRDLAENRLTAAETALDTALARAGLDMLRAALNSGGAYPDALSLLREAGVTVPDTLATHAPGGVPTLEALQDSFPEAARAGLRAALQDMPAETAGERITNFLRAQVGARSTTPREGDDPDAVLSRAAAALEAGALDTALMELDALPEPALVAMQDWRRAAQARHDAEAEFETFATTLSTQ